MSLACLVISLCVIDRTFPMAAYHYWALLSVPGMLYVAAGLRLRRYHQSKRGDHLASIP